MIDARSEGPFERAARLLGGKHATKLPPPALSYFENVRVQYELILDETGRVAPSPVAKWVPSAARDKNSGSGVTPSPQSEPALSAQLPTWADLYALEVAYLAALPEDRLPYTLTLFRADFRELAGERRYGEYMASIESDLAHLSPRQARAELVSLAEWLRNVQDAVRSQQQSIRVRLSASVIGWAFLVLILVAYVYWQARALGVAPPLLLVAIFGSVGSFVSVQQRLQSQDEVATALRPQGGWHGIIAFAPLTGAVAAVLLYVLFLAHFVAGAIFPAFPVPSASRYPLPFSELIRQSFPATLPDYAKLAIWSFIAGFAERFVPSGRSALRAESMDVDADSRTLAGIITQADALRGLSSQLNETLESAIKGPVLDNYSGYACVSFRAAAEPAEFDSEGSVALRQLGPGSVDVWLQSTAPERGFARAIAIEGGRDEPTVSFNIVVDSNTLRFHKNGAPLTVPRGGISSRLTFEFDRPLEEGRHEIFINLIQKNRRIALLRPVVRVGVAEDET